MTQINNVTHSNSDNRLAPNQRKHPELWQLYLTHQELMEMRKRHNLRLSSIERGKSSLQGTIENQIIEMFNLDVHVSPKSQKQIKENGGQSIFEWMVDYARQVGPIYDWLIGHKGVGESLAVKLLALVDDIEKFNTIAKLWRHAGYGLYEYWQDETGKLVAPFDGWKWQTINGQRYRVWTIVCPAQYQEYYEIPNNNEWAISQNIENEPLERVDFIEPGEGWKLVHSRDRLVPGYHSPYSAPLKSLLFLFGESFVKQRTPTYRDIYDCEKARQRELHPDLTHSHSDFRARRKMQKEFLKQFWLTWREFEGLPVSECNPNTSCF